MRFRFLILFVGLILVLPAGCSQKKEISGKTFVPREVLVNVLVDLHLVDGITNDRKFYRKFEEVDSIDVFGPILVKYQLSLQMFDTTMYEYSRFPQLLDEVYIDVLTKLNIMLDENDLEDIIQEDLEQEKISKPEE